MTVTSAHTDRLGAIRERTRRAREARARARETMSAAQQAGDQDAQAVASLALDAASQELEISEALEVQMLGMIAGVDPVHGYGSVGGGGGFLDNPETIATLQRLGHSSMPIGRLDLGPVSSREQLVQRINSGDWGPPKRAESGGAGMGPVPDSARLGAFYGLIPQPRRRLRLLDLIPSSPMDGQAFSYAQEDGNLNMAGNVAEGQIKPEGNLTLTEAEVIARTIAVWIKMLRQQLADVPSLSSVVNERLTYAVLRRVEDQIIGGDGAGENLLGILNTTGVQQVDFAAGVPLTDLPLDAIVDVDLADAEADAVVLNPRDWATMVSAVADDGHRLDGPGAFAMVPDRLWGLPIVTSIVMPAGTALVGAFATAARLFIRETVNVRISDADQDDFVRNRVTALAEGRFGLAVWAPSAFAVVSLTGNGAASG